MKWSDNIIKRNIKSGLTFKSKIGGINNKSGNTKSNKKSCNRRRVNGTVRCVKKCSV